MSIVGRVPEGKPYSVKTILGYFTSWKTVLFTLIFSTLLLLRHHDMLILLTSKAMQPFGSQPATSFVFWLKAHNIPKKPIVYTVAQIVCFTTY